MEHLRKINNHHVYRFDTLSHQAVNLQPNDTDKKITRQLKEAAAIMEIPVIDHIIVTQSGYFSFADEGIL